MRFSDTSIKSSLGSLAAYASLDVEDGCAGWQLVAERLAMEAQNSALGADIKAEVGAVGVAGAEVVRGREEHPWFEAVKLVQSVDNRVHDPGALVRHRAFCPSS